MIKSVFIFLFFCYTVTSAQQNTWYLNNSTKVAENLIVGFWESVDSNKYRIEFTDEQWAMKLLAEVGVAGGYFFQKDSLNRIELSGWAPNWPPFTCALYFISSDTLQVSTWYLESDFISRKYVRAKEK